MIITCIMAKNIWSFHNVIKRCSSIFKGTLDLRCNGKRWAWACVGKINCYVCQCKPQDKNEKLPPWENRSWQAWHVWLHVTAKNPSCIHTHVHTHLYLQTYWGPCIDFHGLPFVFIQFHWLWQLIANPDLNLINILVLNLTPRPKKKKTKTKFKNQDKVLLLQ